MSTPRDAISQTAADLRRSSGGRLTQEQAERRVIDALRRTGTDLTDRASTPTTTSPSPHK